MSLSHDTMLELMQYADGELEGEARARVEALIRSSPEARGVVDAMGVLGDVVRDGVDDRVGNGRPADGIAQSVMAAIALGAHIGVAPASQLAPSTTRGAVVSIAGRAPRRQVGVVGVLFGVIAVAAGLALFLRFHGDAARSPEMRFGSAAPGEASGELAAESPSGHGKGGQPGQAEALGVDLEEVRSVENKVDVFFTPPAKSGAASVVVWIDDRHVGKE
jgi:hypothetical protein